MFEFTLGLFAGMMLWPWWVLSAFIILCLIDAALVENESAGFGTALMIVGTAALVWIGSGNPFALAWEHIGALAVFIFGYFIAGGVWSLFKLYIFLTNVKEEMKEKGLTERPYKSYVRNNKARILSWIGHWPFSIIGTFFGDFLYRIGNRIYNYLGGTYERIEKHVFGDMA
jgi:membrane-bound ClpP family serine protease